MVKDIIKVPKDYNFRLNLEFLTRSTREILHVVDDGHIYKAIHVEGKPILFRVSSARRTFEITYPGRAPGVRDRNHILKYVREWFDLETDLTSFYKLAQKDSLLKAVVKKYYGYRIVGQPDLFESLCWAVIGQQINLAFAYSLKQRFVEHFGERVQYKNQTYYLFPKPEVVATLGEEHLLPLQFSRQKTKYVRLIAEAFTQNFISRESISLLSFPDARQKLMSIKGVGNWTANYALMKTFRYAEAFPLEDAGLHNAIKNIRKLPAKPTLEQVKRIFKKYKGWEAYATLYLWKTL